MSSISHIIRAGEDIMIDRYYLAAMGTLFFYDYFLTLSDEVQYMWNGEKSWMFYIFLINRYAPFVSQTWGVVGFTIQASPTHSLCRGSTIVKILTLVTSTLISQVVMGTRAYALSGFNRKLLAVFLSIGATYVVLAVAIIHNIVVAVVPYTKEPFEALGMCLKNPGRALGFSCTAAVLAFDIAAVIVIVYQVSKLSRETFGLSKLPRVMFRDATVYCLVIFIYHLGLIISVNVARPGLKIIPAIGLEVMIPIMISRSTLALRRVVGGPSSDDNISTGVRFFALPQTSYGIRNNQENEQPGEAVHDHTLTQGGTVQPSTEYE